MQTLVKMIPSHMKLSAAGMKMFIPVIIADGKSCSMGGRCGRPTHTDARQAAKDAIELIEAGVGTLADFQTGSLGPYIARKQGLPPQDLWVIINETTESVCLFANPVEGQENDPCDYVFGYLSEAEARAHILDMEQDGKSVMQVRTADLITVCRKWGWCFAVFYPDDMVYTFK